MDRRAELSHQRLMSCASRPDDAFTQAFAGTVRNAIGQGVLPVLAFGLGESRFNCLLDRYFRGGARRVLQEIGEICGERAPCPPFREDEIEDLAALLLDHRTNDRDETFWLAHALAMGCMGVNHLWEDMGLSSRQALSDLLRQKFTALHDKNTGNMKWKKFFYKQLCVREEINVCRSPSCQVCDEYQKCFGPEDATGALSAVSDTASKMQAA